MTNEQSPGTMRRVLTIMLTILLALTLLLYFGIKNSDSMRRTVELKAVDTMANIGAKRMREFAGEEGSVAADFINNPIEVRVIAEGIYQATGVANTHLIATSAGDVLFDSGLSTQVPKQIKVLEEVRENPKLTHIIVSHSHADHSGGVKFWRQEGTEVIAHAAFAEEQRYLTELQPYFWKRNRTLFPFIPEKPPEIGLIAYGGIEPDRVVGNGTPYQFTQGGVDFEVIAAPGAEGADNLLLWLPQQKILFSGDFFGPLFPQFPNIFTMRGEKIRKPVEYLRSLEMVAALEPEVIVPSHRAPITDPGIVKDGISLIYQATRYVHDQTIAGMNAGKTVEQLMDEIVLPEEMQLTEEHGKVSWAVKSIWEYYATWFHFDRTTELYSVPAKAVSADIVSAAGTEALLARATAYLESEQPLHALHLLEIVLDADPNVESVLLAQKAALNDLLVQAQENGKNSYEIYWLQYQLRNNQAAMTANTNKGEN